jgi:hypothetical protein
MKINADYMSIMRSGARVTRSQYRKEIESGVVLFWCMAGAVMLVLIAVLTGGF